MARRPPQAPCGARGSDAVAAGVATPEPFHSMLGSPQIGPVRDVTLRPAHATALFQRRNYGAHRRELSLVPDEVIPAVLKSHHASAHRVSPTSTDKRRMADNLLFQTNWTFWIDTWEKGKEGQRNGVTHKMQEVGSFHSIREFWQFFNNLPLHSIQHGCSLHLFKRGIRPTWEDPANRDGGHFRISRQPGGQPIDGKLWLDLCLALVGEQFTRADQVAGASFASRPHDGHHASLWIRPGAQADPSAVAIRERLAGLVGQHATLVWVSHREAKSRGGPVVSDRIALRHRRARSTPQQVSAEFIENEVRALQERSEGAPAAAVSSPSEAGHRGAAPAAPAPQPSHAAGGASGHSALSPLHRSTPPQSPRPPAPPPPTPAADTSAADPEPDLSPHLAPSPAIPPDAAACRELSPAALRALRARQLRAAAEEDYEQAIVIRDLIRAAGRAGELQQQPAAEAPCPPPPPAPAPDLSSAPPPGTAETAGGEGRRLINPVTGAALPTAAERRGAPGHRRRHTDTAKGDFIPTEPLPRPRQFAQRAAPAAPAGRPPGSAPASSTARPPAAAPAGMAASATAPPPTLHCAPRPAPAPPSSASSCSTSTGATAQLLPPDPPPDATPVQPLQPLPAGAPPLSPPLSPLPLPQRPPPPPAQTAPPLALFPADSLLGAAGAGSGLLDAAGARAQPGAVQCSRTLFEVGGSPPTDAELYAAAGSGALDEVLCLCPPRLPQPPQQLQPPPQQCANHLPAPQSDAPPAYNCGREAGAGQRAGDARQQRRGGRRGAERQGDPQQARGGERRVRPTPPQQQQPARPPQQQHPARPPAAPDSAAAPPPPRSAPSPPGASGRSGDRGLPQCTASPFVHNGRLYPSGLTRKQRRAILFDHSARAELGCPDGIALRFEVPDGAISAREYNEVIARNLQITGSGRA
eukprot:TRINITY_DN10127_c1_g1_i1.p1 TRINITY_DN10127_c1_g1~~TRINITY_DN10127_c1_g1_i1.p1  ORF type:complete len:947 (+),score=188.43 TRINITY_DN10127_c1_g1_i1:74-2842(+)